jgi:hypothetical protein
MNPNPQSQANAGLRAERGIFARVLWFLVGYCAISCLTLPFIGRVWLGELPVLAVIQLPKIAVAGWLRTHVVMETITFLGFSRGSFSPDYILARPYALALTYLIPMVVIGFIGLRRSRFIDRRRNFVTVIFLVAAAIDYVFTLIFADGRYLTIY